MYESNNVEYLDCCNSSAHVGHCHPQVELAAPFSSKHKVLKCQFQVVGKGQQQMGKLVTAQGFISENLRKYVKVVLVKQKDQISVNFVSTQSLVASLPESLSVCFFTTSGPEANDLAMRLVKRYTGETDIMVVEEAHHGNIGIMLDISPKMHSK